jgi:hypothetical protein
MRHQTEGVRKRPKGSDANRSKGATNGPKPETRHKPDKPDTKKKGSRRAQRALVKKLKGDKKGSKGT